MTMGHPMNFVGFLGQGPFLLPDLNCFPIQTWHQRLSSKPLLLLPLYCTDLLVELNHRVEFIHAHWYGSLPKISPFTIFNREICGFVTLTRHSPSLPLVAKVLASSQSWVPPLGLPFYRRKSVTTVSLTNTHGPTGSCNMCCHFHFFVPHKGVTEI